MPKGIRRIWLKALDDKIRASNEQGESLTGKPPSRERKEL